MLSRIITSLIPVYIHIYTIKIFTFNFGTFCRYRIWDSHAIIIYLINEYAPDSKLLPKDAKQNATVMQRLFFDANVFEKLKEIVVRRSVKIFLDVISYLHLMLQQLIVQQF